MIKREITLNMPLTEVLKLAYAWLLGNGFKIHKEVVKKSRSVTVAKSPAYGSIEIYISSNPHKSNVLLRGKNEVLALITYLQSGGMPLQSQLQQQQQQQIVVNFMPPPPAPPVVMAANVTLKCPFCHAQLPNAGAMFCRRCGQRLTSVQPAPPPLASDSIMFCNACGAHLAPNAAFCKKCGVAIVPIAPTESVRETKPLETPELVFCSYCGAENDGTAEVCCDCGASLTL
ncbi:MAG: zinc ribbon domain-containing protein [Candidatus Helarchaeota archaeon]|nr:zinc ribbon domain-containing protein [Candidatus Helarchaeota archaeon]